jgi:predicted Fe-Mo cluster-binding NifX family protein
MNLTKRIAIPVFNNRVSPRFGYTSKIVIVDIDKSNNIINESIIDVESINSYSIPQQFFQLKINVIICGGINSYFQQLFEQSNIQVIWGIIGDYKEVILLYLSGKLKYNNNYCYRRPRRHRRQNKREK